MQLVPRWSKSSYPVVQPVAEAPQAPDRNHFHITQAIYRLWEASVCLATPGVSGDEQSFAVCFYD